MQKIDRQVAFTGTKDVAEPLRFDPSRRVTLLRNERNLGFVQSVNRGMVLHPDRDVVLLNSDTEVANDWLDRLSAAAHSARDIATATPFSNSAGYCGFPRALNATFVAKKVFAERGLLPVT